MTTPSDTAKQILELVHSGGRLSPADAEALLASFDLTALGAAADEICRHKHGNKITYVIDRNINYTNVCCSECSFCAFYRAADENGAYVLSDDEIAQKIEGTIALGGTRILMQGGLHPDLDISYYTNLLQWIKARFRIRIHAFSPPEVVNIARINHMSIKKVLAELIAAGLDSLPGGGAEILDDEIRNRVSPNKCSAAEWIEVMREAHRQGLKSTATMVIGLGENNHQRVNHLQTIRDLQDETGGFTNFIPWTFQPANTKLGGEPLGGFEYLRILAVARLFLDNIDTVQASWVTQGKQVAQAALRFGANDFGSTMIEENVVKAAGATYSITLEEITQLIHDAGFEPQQREG